MKPNPQTDLEHGTRETLALLTVLALGDDDIEESKVTPVREVVERLRRREKEHG